MTGFKLFCANRDGCHMWGRKCSLFPEHLISAPFGEFMILPFHYNIHYIIYQSSDYVYGLMTLVCLPGLVLTVLSWTCFIEYIYTSNYY